MNWNRLLNRTTAPPRQSGESGQALVETAISLSLLVFILIGAAEIGRIAYAAIQVTNAARAAVQYGDQSRTTAADSQGIKNAAALEAPLLPNMNTTIAPAVCTCADTGLPIACTYNNILPDLCIGSSVVETLTVQTSDNFNPLIDLPGLPSTYPLSAQVTQQVLSSN